MQTSAPVPTGGLPRPAVVTFDLFSALLDWRAGAEPVFVDLAQRYRWPVDPATVRDRWDARNKDLQRHAVTFAPYRALAQEALAAVYDELDLSGRPDVDTAQLLGSMPRWPHWPDVPEGVTAVARAARVAVLSNVDDDLLAGIRPGYEFAAAVTSQQAGSYKPHRDIYDHARAVLGEPLVHVPASARDTRGALEAGVAVVRVRRPGHDLHPDGPQPAFQVDDLRELAPLLSGAVGRG